jgi:hypothetical protein
MAGDFSRARDLETDVVFGIQSSGSIVVVFCTCRSIEVVFWNLLH